MGTRTPNFLFYKPAFDEEGYDDEINDNFDKLDARLAVPSGRILFAHPSGNDANDGFSWGTAKKTIMAAYDAIPKYAGPTSEPTGGIIYIADGAAATPTTGQGIWLAGASDPNYASLPAGWRKRSKFGVSFIGVDQNDQVGNGHAGGQTLVIGGSGSVRDNAAVRISGGGGSVLFKDLLFKYPLRVFIAGVDSAGNTIDADGWTFENCGGNLGAPSGGQVPGPCVEYRSGFWNYMRDCTWSGATSTHTPTSIVLVSGTTYRFTTTNTHLLVVGETVIVRGYTPSGYNGIWTITAVTATTFDVDLGSNPAAVSVVGTALGFEADIRAAVLVNGGHYFKMEDCTLNGAGVRVKLSNYMGGLHFVHNDQEGDFVSEQPPLVHFVEGTPAGSWVGGDLLVEGGQIADGTWSHGIVRNDYRRDKFDPASLVVIGTNVIGPATVLGWTWNHSNSGWQNRTSTPASEGQIGSFLGGRLVGQHDGHRRSGAPAAARYANLVPQDTSTWGAKTGSATVTTGKTDPFGLTNAAQLSGAGLLDRQLYRTNTAMAVGDFLIGGVWARAATLGVARSFPLAIGSANSNDRFNNGVSNSVVADMPNAGGGEWEWLHCVGKVTTLTSSPMDTIFAIGCDNGKPMEYAYPVFIKIAAATLTDAEAWELGLSLQSWPDGAPVGAVSTFLSQKLIARGGLGVGNSAAATEVIGKAVVKKIQVFDETGASVGYVPVYSSIT
jgi:hypothetical protein